jgi:hypothetical protein
MALPNVSWLIEFDTAVQRVATINVDNASGSTLVRQINVNPNFHPCPQFGCACDQCTVQVDGDGLAIARRTVIARQHGNYHF